MNESKRTTLLWIALAVLFAVIFVFDISYADDHDKHNGDDNGDVTIDTVLTGGDNALSTRGGISVGGSDMEIADSLATHSILFGLWQGTHTNPYAEADKLEARGNHQAAAEMRCSTKKYQKVYGKGQLCVDAVIYIEPTEITPQTPQDDARIEALYTRIADLESERVQDKAKAEKAAKKVNAMAQRTAQIVQQAPDEAAERRSRARAALKGEE